MLEEEYDVAIIGGGIHGAGIAQAASAAGFKVLLLEKTDWAAGTSQKSSKLIHGGLRYLQTGQIGLVWESLRERERLLSNAPDLVSRNSFYLPVYKNSKHKSWKIKLGLTLYSLLAGWRQHSFSKLPDSQWSQLKGLKTDDLKAVYSYQDAQTDDSLLTKAVVESAQLLGAETRFPAKFTHAEQQTNTYKVTFNQDDTEYETQCRILVNAGGPWVDNIASKVEPKPPVLDADLVQGTHLVISGLISEDCYHLESPVDQRSFFLLPWYGNTLIGTTETSFEGEPDQVQPLQEEEEYLITSLKHYFPDFDVNVLERFAGLRVLPHGSGKLFNRSRETRIVRSRSNNPMYVSVYGGKLTGYRATAVKVMKHIHKAIGRRQIRGDTRTLKLHLQ